MEYNEILNRLAPCGMDCSRCLGYKDGPIRQHAGKLHSLLEGFENHAERFSSFIPSFRKYPSFNEILGIMVGADCIGCRDNETKHHLCSISRCHKDRNLDFCFQCDDYPCKPDGIDTYLYDKWIKMNNRMKEVGVEEYYNETRDIPRYK